MTHPLLASSYAVLQASLQSCAGSQLVQRTCESVVPQVLGNGYRGATRGSRQQQQAAQGTFLPAWCHLARLALRKLSHLSYLIFTDLRQTLSDTWLVIACMQRLL